MKQPENTMEQRAAQPRGPEQRAPQPRDGGGIEVSVIIPAYNAAGTVVRSIDSVRAQHGVSYEIIVIDDCSGDDTAAVVRAAIAPGEPITLLAMASNGGVSAARNAGIRVARGRYLAFLDADDIWLPGKLQQQLRVIEADPAVSLVSCNSRLTAMDGTPLKEGHLNRPPVQGSDAWKTLLIYNFLPTPTVLTHTHMVRDIGGFDEAMLVGEDLDLWIKLGLRGKIAILPEILINYYDVANSLSKRNGDRTGVIVVPMVEKHIVEQRDKLSSAEVRHIRGERAFQVACDMYFIGSYHPSIPIFLRAAFYGNRPVKSLVYVARALVMEAVTRILPKREGRPR